LALDVIGSAPDDREVEAKGARAEPKLAVGRNIRAQRMQRSLTQEKLAHRAGMHPVEVGRAERGVRDMRVSTVVKLARGLDVPPMELLRDI
jgi:transcriptional regulator with XRE-family HTH domain